MIITGKVKLKNPETSFSDPYSDFRIHGSEIKELPKKISAPLRALITSDALISVESSDEETDGADNPDGSGGGKSKKKKTGK